MRQEKQKPEFDRLFLELDQLPDIFEPPVAGKAFDSRLFLPICTCFDITVEEAWLLLTVMRSASLQRYTDLAAIAENYKLTTSRYLCLLELAFSLEKRLLLILHRRRYEPADMRFEVSLPEYVIRAISGGGCNKVEVCMRGNLYPLWQSVQPDSIVLPEGYEPDAPVMELSRAFQDKHAVCTGLFYGPAGCGKRSAVQAIAQISKRTLMRVDARFMIESFYSESVKNISAVFYEYRRLSLKEEMPPLLLIEAAESLFPSSVTETPRDYMTFQAIIAECLNSFEGVLVLVADGDKPEETFIEKKVYSTIAFTLPQEQARQRCWSAVLPTLAQEVAMQLGALPLSYSAIMHGGVLINSLRKKDELIEYKTIVDILQRHGFIEKNWNNP